ncbi:MAG: TonB-dependent receptor [Flavobacteriales bacterium]|nr:TonB-dependent receptor [Flavobacteriales bacterium]
MKIKIRLVFVVLCSNLVFSQKANQDSLFHLAEKQLQEVIIKGKKPVFETKSDRFVFNVEGSSLVEGTNMLNVLQQTPLINIDENQGLNILGVNSMAVVYINNRKSILTGTDLMNYLKTMPADNIVKIEIITSPSAKYDASDAGVINLILKRLENEGWKGNFSMNNEQKRKNSQNSNAYLNYHKGKFTQSTTFHIGENRMLTYNNINNLIYSTGTTQRIDATILNKDFHIGGTHSMDYELNENNLIGAVVELHTNLPKIEQSNSNFTLSNTGVVTNPYFSNSQSDGQAKMVAGNLFYKYNNNKTNRSFETNFDWVYHNMYNNTQFSTYQSNPNIWDYANSIGTDESKRNYALRLDYAQPLGSYNLEIGAKSNYLNLDSPYNFSLWNGTNFINDTNKTNAFKYEEFINAGYLNLSKTFFKKLNVKSGLRVENTDIKTLQEVNSVKSNQNYTNWLPYLNLNYKFNDNHNLTLSYKKSIWRPFANELNPFVFFTNLENVSTGNPRLLPRTKEKYQVSYTIYKSFTIFSYYQNMKNLINSSAVKENEILIRKPQNLNGNIDEYYLGLSVNKSIFKNKININSTAGLIYFNTNQVNTIDNLNLKSDYVGRVNFNITYNNILNTGINLGLYNSFVTASNYINYSINKPSLRTTFEFSKEFKNGFEVEFGGWDPFSIYQWESTFYAPEASFTTNINRDLRGIYFSVIKKFGNTKSKSSKKTESYKGRIWSGNSSE